MESSSIEPDRVVVYDAKNGMTMNAWSFSRRGHIEDVLELGSIPAPDPQSLKPDELLIKVSHSALQPFCYILAWAVPMFLRTKPVVPELDFSGRVVAKGKDVTQDVGDDVFGWLSTGAHVGKGNGTMAEYVVATKDNLTYKPRNVSFEEAAGLATGGVTALFVLSKSGLRSGDRVLVNGGSGGTGLAILQVAKSVVGDKGVVVTTCSAANSELVREFGADEVVDYTQHRPLSDFLAKTFSATPFDAIIDTVGTSQVLYRDSPRYLGPGKPFLEIGTYLGADVTFGNVLRSVFAQLQNTMWPAMLGGTPRPWIFVQGDQAGVAYLQMLRSAVEEGQYKVMLDGVYPMEDAKKAYARITSRRARGKVIVKIQDV